MAARRTAAIVFDDGVFDALEHDVLQGLRLGLGDELERGQVVDFGAVVASVIGERIYRGRFAAIC